MAKCTISRSEAVNLFVKILAKYLNESNELIEENLSDYLIKYRKSINSTEVAEQTLKPIANNRFATENYYPHFLLDLSTEIETNVPISRTRQRMELILAYINESDRIKRYKFDNAQDFKQDFLIGTHWRLYTYEQYQVKTSKEKRILITRDAVTLNNFGYATLVNPRTFEGELIGKLQYTGQYRTKNNRYLILDMLSDETGDKELRVIIDIGTGSSSIGDTYTGYYLIASNKLYFGPVILERIDKVDITTPRVFKEHDTSINIDIWNYFSGLEVVPDEIKPSFGTRGRLYKFLDT